MCIGGGEGPELQGVIDRKHLQDHGMASGPQLRLEEHLTMCFILQRLTVQDVRTEGPNSIDSVNLIWRQHKVSHVHISNVSH